MERIHIQKPKLVNNLDEIKDYIEWGLENKSDTTLREEINALRAPGIKAFKIEDFYKCIGKTRVRKHKKKISEIMNIEQKREQIYFYLTNRTRIDRKESGKWISKNFFELLDLLEENGTAWKVSSRLWLTKGLRISGDVIVKHFRYAGLDIKTGSKQEAIDEAGILYKEALEKIERD